MRTVQYSRYISAHVTAGLLVLGISTGLAGPPAAQELDPAIRSGDFNGYLASVTAWINDNAPANSLSEKKLDTLLTDADFAKALAQRQFISKCGAENLGAFAKTDEGNKAFLSWLLENTNAVDVYLVAATPLGLGTREENTWGIDTASLGIWKRIHNADPDAKDGLFLKLAVATAIAPPGSRNIGAGSAAEPADPVVRYKYFKTAYQNRELLPSFEHLSAWEYTHVVCSGASDADLTWARDMINTFRPDLKMNERVVKSTSLVWRRNAPSEFYPAGYVTFKNILAGGGKCGPKSSWGQMVNHAFGVPAIGVGQPAHACVAYKSAYPENEPQPGNVWKVDYGRAWSVSKLLGMSGPDFFAAATERLHTVEFSRVEHLRWMAAALTGADRTAAVMKVAHAIQASLANATTETAAAPNKAAPKMEPVLKATVDPIKARAGLLHVDAAAFAETGGTCSWGGQKPYVEIHDCTTGGKQVYFEQQMKEQWADYLLDVPEAGVYTITMKAACINVDQRLEVLSGTTKLADVAIPMKFGLWAMTEPVQLNLKAGVQKMRVQTPTSEHMRGVAVRFFELKKV